jgi:hypothetical protein
MIGQPGMHPYSERAADLYETPSEATEALLRAEGWPTSRIWEPCAGRGAISRVLARAGHRHLSRHRRAFGSGPRHRSESRFLRDDRGTARLQPDCHESPFKDANRFIRHGLKLDCEVVVLLRLMALEGAGSADLIDRHLARVRVGIERLPPMHRDGWLGAKVTSSPVAYAWFVFSPLPRTAGSPVDLRRISWRAS